MAGRTDLERGLPPPPCEATPLLTRGPGGRRGYFARSDKQADAAPPHPHVLEGPCLTVHAPPGPCDDQGRRPPRQLLRYNPRYAGSVFALVQLRGTAFASWAVWLHVLGYAAVSAAVCAAVFFAYPQPELLHTERVNELASYAASLLSALLALHLAAAVQRWWALRTGTLGRLWSAVADISMVLAAHLPQPGSAALKSLILRYSLASFELTFMQAQGTDGVLGALVKQELLSDDEKRKLEELVSKPQAMWVWIAGILQRLAERGRLSSRMLVLFYGICARARSAVGRGQGVFAYLDTQWPFPYVHLLSVFVHLNSIALAVKCGMLSAVAIWNLRRAEREDKVSHADNLHVLLLQVFLVIWAQALLRATLEESSRLGEPFGDGLRDFPRRAYHEWMRSDCEALLAAGEALPAEVLQATEEFEVREGDLVHDRVAIVEAPHAFL